MKKKIKMISKKKLMYVIIIFIVVLNSLTGLYEKRHRISKGLNELIFLKNASNNSNTQLNTTKGYGGQINVTENDKKNIFWVKELKKGGYFLLFRHAHREKWEESVIEFDAYSLFENIDQENSNFKEGVCLSSPRGTEQAKMIGNIFRAAKVKIDKVFSSPSCRSTQTAKLAFNKIDQIWNCLLHPTAINPKLVAKCGGNLKKKILSQNILKGHNIILSSHGNTVDKYGKFLWDENESNDLTLEEGGFIVMEVIDNKIIIRHSFPKIMYFSLFINNLPIN